MKISQKENGFSLIEVVAAIVIIGIVLLSFSQLFIQSNRIAHKNNEKLVTINLADAMLERLKADSLSITDINDYFNQNSDSNVPLTKPPALIELNGKFYKVSYSTSQNSEIIKNANYTEEFLGLVRVVVTVTAPDKKTKGSSEGYVSLE